MQQINSDFEFYQCLWFYVNLNKATVYAPKLLRQSGRARMSVPAIFFFDFARGRAICLLVPCINLLTSYLLLKLLYHNFLLRVFCCVLQNVSLSILFRCNIFFPFITLITHTETSHSTIVWQIFLYSNLYNLLLQQFLKLYTFRIFFLKLTRRKHVPSQIPALWYSETSDKFAFVQLLSFPRSIGYLQKCANIRVSLEMAISDTAYEQKVESKIEFYWWIQREILHNMVRGEGFKFCLKSQGETISDIQKN